MKQAPEKTIKAAEPLHLHQHAEANLRFIRASMESVSAFTGVSGKGYFVTGLSAVAASWLAAQQASTGLWLSVWLLELLLAASMMLIFTRHKTQEQGSSLFASASGRKLLLAFLPAISVGGMLTLFMLQQDLVGVLPVLWLSIYGAAVITAGAHSVKVLPLMGILFVLLATLTAFTSLNANLALGLGFGVLHIGFGAYIWKRHGG